MSRYDKAITVFSPSGNLFQVEYAMQAVQRGLCAVAIRTEKSIFIGIQKKSITVLQDSRTVKKVLQIDRNIIMTFAGLNADARVLANKARDQCQEYRKMYEDDPPIDYVANYIARIQQKHTQKGGVRPIGASTLLSGFDNDKKPRLFLTEPSGNCTEWTANTIGNSSKQVLEFLEKNYEKTISEKDAADLVVKSLMDVVESGAKNISLSQLTFDGYKQFKTEEVEKIVKELENE